MSLALLQTLLTSTVPFLKLHVFLWCNQGRSKDGTAGTRGVGGADRTGVPRPGGLHEAWEHRQGGLAFLPGMWHAPKPSPPLRPGVSSPGAGAGQRPWLGAWLGGGGILQRPPGHSEWAVCVLEGPVPQPGKGPSREPRNHNKTPLPGNRLNESLLRQ